MKQKLEEQTVHILESGKVPGERIYENEQMENILKNIGETGWISGENIKHLGVISGYFHRSWGCEIKVFEEGKKPIKQWLAGKW